MGERDRDPAVDHLCPRRRLTIVERQDVVLTLKVLAAGGAAGIAANVRISHHRLAVPSLSVLHSDHMAARRVLDALTVRRRASDRCLDWDCTPLQRGLVGAGPWEPRAFDRSGFRLDTLGGNNTAASPRGLAVCEPAPRFCDRISIGLADRVPARERIGCSRTPAVREALIGGGRERLVVARCKCGTAVCARRCWSTPLAGRST